MWPTQDELFGEIANDDSKVKREFRAGVSSLSTPSSPLLQYARCSSWSLLVKVVAWLFRYRNNLLKASKGDTPRNGSLILITLEEIQRAEGEILKDVQRQSFPEETANPKKHVKKSSRLHKLDPIVADGLLRLGGRLCNSELSSESKNQIILLSLSQGVWPFWERAGFVPHSRRVLDNSGKFSRKRVFSQSVSYADVHKHLFVNRKWLTCQKIAFNLTDHRSRQSA